MGFPTEPEIADRGGDSVMHKDEIFIDAQLDFRKLTAMNQSQLDDWVKVLLQYGYDTVLGVCDRDSYASQLLIEDIWDGIDSSDILPPERELLRRQIRKAVEHLLAGWTPPSESLEYFIELIAASSILNCLSCASILLEYAYEETLKDMGTGFDAHREILKALYVLHRGIKPRQQAKLRRVMKRDIHDSRYAAICFRYLWKSHPEEDLRFLREFVAGSLGSHPLAVTQALARFHITNGVDYLQENLIRIRDTLLWKHSYRGATDPSMLYQAYIKGISEFCNVMYRSPTVPDVPKKLKELLASLDTALDETEGYLIDWYPAGADLSHQSRFVEANTLEWDRQVLLAVPPELQVAQALADYHVLRGCDSVKNHFLQIREVLVREDTQETKQASRCYYREYIRRVAPFCIIEYMTLEEERLGKKFSDILRDIGCADPPPSGYMIRWQPPDLSTERTEFIIPARIDAVDREVLPLTNDCANLLLTGSVEERRAPYTMALMRKLEWGAQCAR